MLLMMMMMFIIKGKQLVEMVRQEKERLRRELLRVRHYARQVAGDGTTALRRLVCELRTTTQLGSSSLSA